MSENKVLVIGPAWVGDMVMTHALFQALRQINPQVVIDVVAPPWSLPILSRMPEINHVYALNVAHGEFGLMARVQLAKEIRKQKYDRAIITPHSYKSALIPFLARIPVRSGWLGEFRYGIVNDWRKYDKTVHPRMVDKLVALAFPKNAPAQPVLNPRLQVDATAVQATNAALGVAENNKPILVLCPGAEYGSAKRWPARHFSALALQYHQQGWRVWILGSPKDVESANAIQQFANHICEDWTGKTSLPQSIDLLSQASVVVSNDSGLLHIAASLNKPCIALYGATPPDFAPPLTDKAAILYLGLECSPCKKRICPLGHHACLEQIRPEMVVASISSVLPQEA